MLAYTEVLSTNGIWDVVARVTGEEPPKSYERSTVAKKKCTCRLLTNNYRLGVGGTTARYHCGVSETTPGKLQVPLGPEQQHGYGQLQHGPVTKSLGVSVATIPQNMQTTLGAWISGNCFPNSPKANHSRYSTRKLSVELYQT